MPDIFTHYAFGQAVCRKILQEEKARMDSALFDVCTVGPDIWFPRGFWQGKQVRALGERGSICQHEKTGAFLSGLAREAKTDAARDALYSFLCGYLCHYALDSVTHPFVIWFTGNYDGTPETRQYRGNHSYMERALDHRYLARTGYSVRNRPIIKIVLRLHRFPDTMAKSIDRVFETVYGWENSFFQLQKSLRDTKFFYWLVEGHGRIMDVYTRLKDDGVSYHDLASLPYYGKEQPELDVENLSHTQWHHPQDIRIASNESFPELFEKAAVLAARMIHAAYAFIFLDGEDPAAVFGNRQYDTGFEYDDPRNSAALTCAPLKFPAKKREKRR